MSASSKTCRALSTRRYVGLADAHVSRHQLPIDQVHPSTTAEPANLLPRYGFNVKVSSIRVGLGTRRASQHVYVGGRRSMPDRKQYPAPAALDPNDKRAPMREAKRFVDRAVEGRSSPSGASDPDYRLPGDTRITVSVKRQGELRI